MIEGFLQTPIPTTVNVDLRNYYLVLQGEVWSFVSGFHGIKYDWYPAAEPEIAWPRPKCWRRARTEHTVGGYSFEWGHQIN